ncbi:hypothetical protein OG884_06200 [Streptosporangium sp. NBC_01755]|uniref:hypothetical protein n=1 Tax=Streptosporangium sp. NBC_01755 TaxID=2975949 RepID=UPI002DD8350B|nr:hypothetical protein [Streptosporangium sp. NBC_01755]WSD01519.1 hypothetical protein OG884_06200 [Streptosporangium sp. NBC_01755]
MTDHWDSKLPAVDLTIGQLNGIIIAISREGRDRVEELKKLNTKAAEARANAEVVFARAFMNADGRPMDERRQIAMLAAADARYKADLADREVAALKKAIDSGRDDMEAARTISANVRDELKTLGGQP